MKIILIILSVSLVLSLADEHQHRGYFITRFPEIEKLFFWLNYNKPSEPESPLVNQRGLCSAVFKSRIFIDANDTSEISQIEVTDENSLVFIDYVNTENVKTGELTKNWTIHHCFFYLTISLYISIIQENVTGPSCFTYYKSSNEAPVKVLGIAEPNATLITNNINEMENLIYTQLKQNTGYHEEIMATFTNLYEDEAYRLCSMGVKYVLEDQPSMTQIYEINPELNNERGSYQKWRIVLTTVIINYKPCYFSSPVLKCTLKRGNGNTDVVTFHMIPHPLHVNSVYMVRRISRHSFRLTMKLEYDSPPYESAVRLREHVLQMELAVGRISCYYFENN